jgi:predicted lipoprotein with Yx(FWY)xxD motif
MPLYTHITDSKQRSYEGGDVPGWHNVFLQRTPSPPKDFQIVDTMVGQVLAEAHGKTIYSYFCIEDTQDMLNCDEPVSPQVYRWAMCGGGDPVRCVKTFPYVIADKGAKSNSIAWGTMDIDPKTGRSVAAGTPDSLHVWAYQQRPIYTFSGDRQVGDIGADGWGEDRGEHNGFSAFWMRDDYSNLDGTHAYY